MNERISTRAGRAFTLIELLVVISIITLLIAVLLPALQKAKEASGRLKCLSGNRQVLISLDVYCNDSREYYPNGDPASGTVWHAWLASRDYLSKDLQTSRGGCPHGPAVFNPGGGSGGDYYTPTGDPAVCYGLNPYIQGGWHFTGVTYILAGPWRRSSAALVRHASQVGVIFCTHVPFSYASQDTCLWPPLDQDFGPPNDPYGGQPASRPIRHGGGNVPVGCADGHAQSMPAEEVTYPPDANLKTSIFYYSTFYLIFSNS